VRFKRTAGPIKRGGGKKGLYVRGRIKIRDLKAQFVGEQEQRKDRASETEVLLGGKTGKGWVPESGGGGRGSRLSNENEGKKNVPRPAGNGGVGGGEGVVLKGKKRNKSQLDAGDKWGQRQTL